MDIVLILFVSAAFILIAMVGFAVKMWFFKAIARKTTNIWNAFKSEYSETYHLIEECGDRYSNIDIPEEIQQLIRQRFDRINENLTYLDGTMRLKADIMEADLRHFASVKGFEN